MEPKPGPLLSQLGTLHFPFRFLILSATAEFFYDTPSGAEGTKRNFITIKSGDGCLFNGGSLHHGVSKILPDTAPDWFGSTTFGKLGARFNLQFRDLVSISNIYVPQFDRKYYELKET